MEDLIYYFCKSMWLCSMWCLCCQFVYSNCICIYIYIVCSFADSLVAGQGMDYKIP